MDIYALIEKFEASDKRSERVVAAIMDDLNDRRGVKQELQSCDDDVLEEMFNTLADIVEHQR